MSNITIQEIAKKLSENKDILLLCHVHPDADTLGSAFALKDVLEAAGHTVNVVCADHVPKRLQFICDMKTSLSEEECRGFKPTLTVSVDTAEPALLGRYSSKVNDGIDIKIDHHPSGSEYAKYNYIDGQSGATGEIVYEIICELERIFASSMTRTAATKLFAAISSDTGCFKYSNVTSKTMKIAAALIDAGADNTDVCYRLFEIKSVSEVVAERIMLNNLKIYRSGTVAVVTVTNEMKEESGITDEDLGNISAELRRIEGIQLGIMIRQNPDIPTSYKISMRSGSMVSASSLCALFGGGGHERAAGATVTAENAEDAEYKVMEAVQSVIGYV